MSFSHKWGAPGRALGIMALAILMTAGCKPSGPKALLSGEQLIREGKFEEAIVRLKMAAELLPTNAQAWNHLGLAYHGAQKSGKAVDAYLMALTLDRNLAAARFNLGCLWLEQNNASAAISELTTFTLLSPEVAAGWAKLGLAQLQAGQLNPAEQNLRQALKLQSNSAETLNGLGLIQLRRNRPADALGFFDQAIRQQTNFAPAVLNAAIVHHQYLRNRPAALQKYREYLDLMPSSTDGAAVREMVRALDMEIQPPPRQTTLANPSPLLAHVITQAAPASLAVSNGVIPPASNLTIIKTNITAAVPPLKPPATQVTGEPPSKPAIDRSTAASLPPAKVVLPAATNVMTRQPSPVLTAPALSERSESPRRDPGKTVSTPSTSTSHQTASRVPQTSPPLPASTAPPAAPRADQTTAARSPSPSAELKSPANEGLLQRLNPANWGRTSGRSKPVTPLSAMPGAAAAPATSLAASAPTSNETPPASRPMTATTLLPPRSMPARYPYRHPPLPVQGNRPEAERHFAQGSQADAAGRREEAMAAYHKAIEADPSFFEARYNLGLAAYQSQQLPAALLQFEQALAIDPNAFNARYNFALALQRANYPRDAASEAETLLAAAPSDTRLLLLLGNLHAQELFQPQLGRKYYTRLLELDPAHAQAMAIRYWLAENP